MVGRAVVHGERRAREMDEVAATLREMGVEPMMATATARRTDWAASLGGRDRFGGEFHRVTPKCSKPCAKNPRLLPVSIAVRGAA